MMTDRAGLEEALREAADIRRPAAEETKIRTLTRSVIRTQGDRLTELIRQIPMNRAMRLALDQENSPPDIAKWDSRYSFIAQDSGGEIVGLVAAYPDDGGIYLAWLAVDPDLQGRGVGRRLFQAVRDAAEDHGDPRLWWEVLSTNAQAQDVYDGLGARVIGRVPSTLGLDNSIRYELSWVPTLAGMEEGEEKGEEEAVREMMGQLFDPASEVEDRMVALDHLLDRVVEPLSRAGDPRALELIPVLRRILLMEDPGLATSDKLRQVAGEGLAIIGDPSGLTHLRDALTPPGGAAWISDPVTRRTLVQEIPKFRALLLEHVDASLSLLRSIADGDPDSAVRGTAKLVHMKVERILTAALRMWDAGLDPPARMQALRDLQEELRGLQQALADVGKRGQYEWIFYHGWEEEPDPEISLGRMSALLNGLMAEVEEAEEDEEESNRAFLQRKKAALRKFVVRMRQRYPAAVGQPLPALFIPAVDRALRFLAEPAWLEIEDFEMVFHWENPGLRAALREAGKAGAERLLLVPLEDQETTLWPYFFGLPDMEEQVRRYLDRPEVQQLSKYGLRFGPLASAGADPAQFQRPGLLIVDRRRPPEVPLAPRLYARLDAQDLLEIHPALAAAQALHPEEPLELLKAQVVGWLIFQDEVTGALYLAVLA